MKQLHRPDPDALLKKLQREETCDGRGRLKVFLGYTSRVGKTQRMLDEARRRKSRGEDVVVGAVQTGDANEAGAMPANLEVVPLVTTPQCCHMDVEAILRRRPAVCVVDELAFQNPEGGQFATRWEEVRYLLQHGIDVLTALNLQHIREQQDQVERITGKRAADAVPEEFIRGAEEIVVVDVPESEVEDAPERERKLSQLRELALILAADVVEGELQRYMDRHGMLQTWGTQERILVCITARSNVRAMMLSGRRNVDRSHGQLFVIYVAGHPLNREGEVTLNENLELSRKMGADVHVVESQDPVRAIVDFAEEHRITQIFIGHTQQRQFWFQKKGVVERIIEEAEGMDVRLFPAINH